MSSNSNLFIKKKRNPILLNVLESIKAKKSRFDVPPPLTVPLLSTTNGPTPHSSNPISPPLILPSSVFDADFLSLDTISDTTMHPNATISPKKTAGSANPILASTLHTNNNPATTAKRAQRYQRFTDDNPLNAVQTPYTQSTKATAPLPIIRPAPQPSAPGGSHQIIIGTSQQLEKRYLRLTSAPLPSDVRPIGVLMRAFEHVMQLHNTGTREYTFTWEQLKSIRQDMTVQGLKNEFTILVYETHAKLSLENKDVPEFNQCLTQLISLYKDHPKSKNLPEFTAYHLLYVIYTDALESFLKIYRGLDRHLIAHPYVAHALSVRKAYSKDDFFAFFALYNKAPQHGVYIMNTYIDRVRSKALQFVFRSHSPSISVLYLQTLLGFPTSLECDAYLSQHHHLVYEAGGKSLINTKESLKSLLSSHKPQ